MDRCLNREAALDRVRVKAEQTEDELGQLHKWKSTMEKKFDLSEQARKELEQKTDEAVKALEIKEKEIQDLKEMIRQAKKVAIREYRDSDALLGELADSFLQGFDDSLCQIKRAYSDLDVSMIKVDDQGQTSTLPVASENTDNLFGEDAVQGDRESIQAKSVQDADPKVQKFFIFFFLFFIIIYFENDPSFIFCIKQLPFEGLIRQQCIIL